MAEFQTRIQHKYDEAANWSRATFPSKKGELYCYAPANAGDSVKIKIGNGTDTVSALPFVGNDKADIASPTFTGAPKAPTPAQTSNDTRIATTAFVHEAIEAAFADIAIAENVLFPTT